MGTYNRECHYVQIFLQTALKQYSVCLRELSVPKDHKKKILYTRGILSHHSRSVWFEKEMAHVEFSKIFHSRNGRVCISLNGLLLCLEKMGWDLTLCYTSWLRAVDKRHLQIYKKSILWIMQIKTGMYHHIIKEQYKNNNLQDEYLINSFNFPTFSLYSKCQSPAS